VNVLVGYQMTKTAVAADSEDTRLILPRAIELLDTLINNYLATKNHEIYLEVQALLEEYEEKYGKSTKRDSN